MSDMVLASFGLALSKYNLDQVLGSVDGVAVMIHFVQRVQRCCQRGMNFQCA